jgi:2,3-dimethylmalate lyase
VQKIRAALAARRAPDFVVIARMDALAVNGWADVVRRCRAYRAAGADPVFVDGITTVDDLHTYARELRDVPKLYNGMLLPIPAVAHLGFQAMITGGTVGVVCKGLHDVLHELKATGIVASHRLASWEDITSLLGLDHVYELEQTYGTSEGQPVGALNPTFKGVWYAAVNFALLPLLDTRPGQYPPPHR